MVSVWCQHLDCDNSSEFCFAATAAKFENAKHLLTLPLVSRCPQSLGRYFIVQHFAGEARFSKCPCLVPTPPSPLARCQRPSMVLAGVSFLWTSSSRVSSATCQALLGVSSTGVEGAGAVELGHGSPSTHHGTLGIRYSRTRTGQLAVLLGAGDVCSWCHPCSLLGGRCSDSELLPEPVLSMEKCSTAAVCVHGPS